MKYNVTVYRRLIHHVIVDARSGVDAKQIAIVRCDDDRLECGPANAVMKRLSDLGWRKSGPTEAVQAEPEYFAPESYETLMSDDARTELWDWEDEDDFDDDFDDDFEDEDDDEDALRE